MAKKVIEPAPGIQIIFTPFTDQYGNLNYMDISIETEDDPVRHSIILDRDNLIDLADYLDEGFETEQWK